MFLKKDAIFVSCKTEERHICEENLKKETENRSIGTETKKLQKRSPR